MNIVRCDLMVGGETVELGVLNACLPLYIS
jgi:hypothetical protein